jgi:glycosyltransferase involved in cell wall biosynthesis
MRTADVWTRGRLNGNRGPVDVPEALPSPHDPGGTTPGETRSSGAMRVTQVSFHRDERVHSAEDQLQAWPTIHGVARGIARAGAEVTVVQFATRGVTLHRDAVEYEFVEGPALRAPALAARMQRLARPGRIIRGVLAARPDVLHVQGFSHPVSTWHLARALPAVPMVITDHASRPPGGMRLALWRRAFGSAAGATFTSRRLAEPFIDAGVLRRDLPIGEVMGGSSNFSPGDQARARQHSGIGGDPCVLWTGHLDANKDPLTVLEAFRLAAANLPDARLWCCFRQAPLRAEVERRIAASPVLRARVTLLGARPHQEMEALFRAADLFVQMSHTESCGFSVIEAMSCGTPPLVSDIPAFRAVVGDAGSLTPCEDAPALAAALRRWSEGDRSRRRHAARERFERALSFDVIGRQLHEMFSSVLAMAKAGR